MKTPKKNDKMKTPKTNTPAQKPLVEIDTGIWIRPETVTSIQAIGQPASPHASRVAVRYGWYGDSREHTVSCTTYEHAVEKARRITAKINS